MQCAALEYKVELLIRRSAQVAEFLAAELLCSGTPVRRPSRKQHSHKRRTKRDAAWCSGNWSTIQQHYFPASRGTSFQSKLKDKWRTLFRGLRKKGAIRSNLPEHLWAQIEALAKVHPML
jgi:hypothetical protein